MPELLALPSCPQPENFHPEGEVYRHTRLMLSMLPRGCTETFAFGTLLHDIAKPRCFAVAADGKMTYYGHTIRAPRWPPRSCVGCAVHVSCRTAWRISCATICVCVCSADANRPRLNA